MSTLYVVLAIAVLVFIVLMKTAIVVPQQSAFVVETLGRFSRTIQAGFHILIPFAERIAYKHTLQGEALDLPEMDARSASCGITNYRFAIIQLAQTTLRSEIGKIDLDRTFEARGTIKAHEV